METLLWCIESAHGALDNGEEEQLLVIRKEWAEETRRQVKALECSTWGEVKALGPETYQEILDLAGYGEYGEEEPPGDDDEFSPYDLPGYEEADWPPLVASLVSGSVPGDILDAYGRTWDTVFNGEMSAIPASNKDQVLAALRTAGYEVVQADWLGELFHREYFAD